MEFHLPSFGHKESTNALQPLEAGKFEGPATINGAEQVGITPQAEETIVTAEVTTPVDTDTSTEATSAELPTPEAATEPADTDHQIPAQV